MELYNPYVTKHLVHPITGELLYGDGGVPVVFTGHSRSSPGCTRAVQDMQARVLKDRCSTKDLATMFLADMSITLTGTKYNGRFVDNKGSFMALYKDQSLEWMREQIDVAIGEKYIPEPKKANTFFEDLEELCGKHNCLLKSLQTKFSGYSELIYEVEIIQMRDRASTSSLKKPT